MAVEMLYGLAGVAIGFALAMLIGLGLWLGLRKLEETNKQVDDVHKDLDQVKTTLAQVQQAITNAQSTLNTLPELRPKVLQINEDISFLVHYLTGRRSGQVGEQIVKEILSPIPDDWLERKVKLGSGEVEFAIKMPGGYLIPMDSKFVGLELIEKLKELEKNGNSRQDLLQGLLKEVREGLIKRAKEIAEKYIIDQRTLGFGIAAVPDSVYDLCRDAVKAAAQRHCIVVVPYGLLLPFVLSLYLIAQRLGISIRLDEARQAIGAAQTALGQAKKKLESMEREITTISNQRSEALTQLDNALRQLSTITGGDISLPSQSEVP